MGLKVGDEAYALVTDPQGKSKTRWALRGAAVVRIEAIAGDTYHTVVVRGSGTWPGEPIEYKRTQLYAKKDAAAEAEFKALVMRMWPPAGWSSRRS